MANATSTETSTIKASGGDYTTLATWWTAKKGGGGGANVAAWAECYSGGDMGEVTLNGAGYTPTATYYTRIYAATGERHDGLTGGAYSETTDVYAIRNELQYTRIEGIRLVVTSSAAAVRAILMYPDAGGGSGDGGRVEGCLVDIQGVGANDQMIGIYLYARDGTYSLIARNNLILGNNTAFRAIGIYAVAYAAAANATLALTLDNNSVSQVSSVASLGINQSGGIVYWSGAGAGKTSNCNVTSRNNISTDHGTDFHEYLRVQGGTENFNIAQTYCLSADDTADDWGGDGNVINEAGSDVFENVASDLSLEDGSPAIGAGTNLYAHFQTDAIGKPWPITADWDMGALVAGPGYYLYRGTGGIANVDFSTPVGTVIGAASSKTWTGLGHAANTRYTYALRPWRRDTDGQILETPDYSCVAEFETDGDTEWLGDRPGPVEALTAEIISGGEIRLRWRYRTPYGGTAPNDFGIYYGTSPNITPGSPNTTEDYTADGEYSKDLALTDGVAYYFAITARDATPVESHLSGVIGPYIADDTAPDTPSLLTSTTF